jgi:geranylgeranyl diphosphate synthase, type I
MDIREVVKAKCSAVEPFLREYAQMGDERMQKMVMHPIEAGGKRIRPCMTLLACEAVGGDLKSAMPAAAAVELLHTFTLVHDDIMDHDEQRRGRPTVHSIWGEEMGIIVGDTLYSSAFKALIATRQTDVPSERVLDAIGALVEANGELQEGQIMDMLFEDQNDVSEDEYMKMIWKKTGSLIEAAVKLGCIVGGGTKDQLEALKVYGANCGVAFQIRDDVLDLTADQKEFGKPVGSDIRKGKKTLIVVHALAHAGKKEKAALMKTLGDEKASAAAVKSAIGILRKTGSIDYADRKVSELIEEAKNVLGELPESDARRSLSALADYLVERRT